MESKFGTIIFGMEIVERSLHMILEKNDKVILMPFCVESVFLYHKLKREQVKVSCFFDNKKQYMHRNDTGGGMTVLVFFHLMRQI